MKSPTLFRNFIIFSLILGVCMGVLGFVGFKASEEIKITDARVTHSQKVIIQGQELINIITGVLTQQRNLLVATSIDENAIKEYEEYKIKMSDQIGLLKNLVIDNPAQSSRFNEIEHLSLKFKDVLDQDVANFRATGVPPSLKDRDSIVLVRDNMLRLSQDALKQEYELLFDRDRLVSQKINQYETSLLVGGGVACLIMLLLNWFLLQAQSKTSEIEVSLKESEERLRLAIRGSNDGIFDWNLMTHDIYWSNQYKAMLGYDENEIKGSEANFRKLIHPDDSQSFWDAFNNYINGNSSEFSCIFRMLHKNGREVWIHARGKALFDENGKPQRFIGAHTDVSYIKEHEKQLKEERDRAEAASAAKGEFLAHMSHEIRTPLTAVSGIAEIFSQSPSIDDNHKKLVSTLKTSTESLKELITDILDFSKIESGEVELHNQKFFLHELFEQVISIMSVKAREKFLDFSFDFNGLESTIFSGDKQRIRQILINLIGNAIKFTERGHVRVKATVEAVAGANILRIDIEDTGIGISDSAKEIIFEKFRQADSSVSRRYGGTGLGLPISKSLAEIMGGTIRVESEQGKGSTFSVVLPFSNVAVDEDVTDIGEVVKMQKLNDRLKDVIGDKKRVLLVEDYEGNIVVLSYLLNTMDCSFDVAKTGLEAVQQWKAKHYDLILMDIQMPEMDGLTATRTIRKVEEEQSLSHTPIIGLTAHALVADKQKCIDAGMDDYLSKPIVEADLKSTMLRIFEKQDKAAA